MPYANFFSKKGGGWTLLITEGPDIRHGLIREISVSGKREARKLAKQYGAKCWNF